MPIFASLAGPDASRVCLNYGLDQLPLLFRKDEIVQFNVLLRLSELVRVELSLHSQQLG